MPTHYRIDTATTLRATALAALFGAASLIAPLQAARAQTPEDVPSQKSEATAYMNPPGIKAHRVRHETIEQRIASLHASLKITPDEEAQWADVAQRCATTKRRCISCEKLSALRRLRMSQRSMI
jgi:hypothetical protein